MNPTDLVQRQARLLEVVRRIGHRVEQGAGNVVAPHMFDKVQGELEHLLQLLGGDAEDLERFRGN